MAFDSAAPETSVQYVQSGNELSIPAINYFPRTLEQSRLEFKNTALNRDKFPCSQYRHSTYVSPLSCYVSKSTSCNNVDTQAMDSWNHNHSSALIDTDTTSDDCTVITSNLAGRPYTPFGMLCNNGLALSISCFPQHIFHPEEPKPQYSYIGLIAMAILSSAETKLVLSDIYQYILDNYPYFRARGPGWRNSIRHNLSLNDCFLKSGRSANGKGHYWGIHPANIDDFRKGDFRRRKAQRKVRKHMGLPLDAVGPDSPSPPPSSTSPAMVSTISFNMPQTPGSASETSYEYPLVQNGVSRDCIEQKLQLPHYQRLLPSSQHSLPYSKHRQQIRDSYFGGAIMEQYSSMPASFYNTNLHATSILSHKQCNGYPNNKLFNSFTHNNALLFLAQQKSNDIVRISETSKPICCSRTAAKSSSIAIGSTASIAPQKHKRQFDVASLLAPDRKDFDSEFPSKEATEVEVATVKHTKNFRSVRDDDHQTQTSQYCKQLLHRQLFVSSALQQQIRLTRDDQEDEEIVDVVASDIVDVVSSNIENTRKQESPLILFDKENKVYADKMHVKKRDNKGCEDTHIYSDCSLPPKSNLMQEQYTDIQRMVSNAPASLADFQSCYASKLISTSASTHLVPLLSKTVKTASILDCAGSESLNNGIHQMQLYSHLNAGNPVTPHNIAHRQKHVKRLIHQIHKHNSHLGKLDADLNIQSFGHYYGSYMAAAAHIETMQLAELQRQKLPLNVQPKLQSHQQ